MQRLRERIAGGAGRVRDTAHPAPLHAGARDSADDSVSLLFCLAFPFCLLWRTASRPQRPQRGREGLACARPSAWTRFARASAFWLACSSARQKGNSMLRIYHVVLEVLKQLQPAMRRIEVRDRDLARQLKRCSSSVALNLAEGMYSRGKNRAARYHSALGSARETLACLEVAVVCGYVQQDPSTCGGWSSIPATPKRYLSRCARFRSQRRQKA